MMSRKGFLRLEWGLSLAFVAVALLWVSLRGLPLAEWRATPGHLARGVASGAALWLAIPLLFWAPQTRRILDTVVVPFSRALAPRDVVVVAVLSGVSEELFFRGVLLAEIGLIGSSVLFGLLHALTWVYAAWAAVIGAGFAILALEDSLVTTAVAHATYNLGALVALRRRTHMTTPEGEPHP